MRIGWASLRLMQPDGAPVAWPALFAALPPDGVVERSVMVEKAGKGRERPGQPLFPARLIVRRLAPGAAARAASRVCRKHSKCRAGAVLQPMTVQSAGFLMLLTSLPPAVSAAEVLAAYRVRWQVELAFKRLKGLLGLGRLPAKCRALARSWLLAHLILALLIEGFAQELLESRPLRPATHRSCTSLWRITQMLRDALLAAVRGLLSVAAWQGAASIIARHLCERPRRRRTQQTALHPTSPP